MKAAHYRAGVAVTTLLDYMRRMRKDATTAEDFLWALLRRQRMVGVKFRRQHQVGVFICDFYCHAARLIIECDGGYHEDPAQLRRDEERDEILRAEGFTVLHFRNEEVLSDPRGVLETIVRNLHEHRI